MSYGLVGYSDAVAAEIFGFQRQAFSYRRSDWIEPRWRWMFLASAARLETAPMVWLYRNRLGVVGHQGAIPVRLKIGGTEQLTGWFVETAVLDSVRGKAIGPMMIAKAKQDLPFNLSLGQTPEMRAIQIGLGWQHICPLGSYRFVLNARRALERKVPNRWLRSSAALVLTLVQRLKYLAGRRRLRWTPAVREVRRFDDSHTRLWNAVKDSYPCAVVRDASYLNWKYVEQPGQDYIRLEIHRHGELVALAILAVLEPSEARSCRWGVLVDLVVSPHDHDVAWALLDVVRQTFTVRGADLMIIPLTSDTLSRRVSSFGFFDTAPTRVFLVSPEDLSSDAKRLVCAPGSWLLTGGDSDIDRPW